MGLNNPGGIGAIEDWQAPTFQNGWVQDTSPIGAGNASPCGFYKDPLGMVHFRGRIKSGSALSTAFTLPQGYRPEFSIRFFILGVPSSTVTPVGIFLFSDGRLQPESAISTFLPLEAIKFRAV